MRPKATTLAATITPWRALLVLAATALLIGAAAALAQDDVASAEPRRCIDLRQIQDTDIVDDDTILFRMRGGEVYRNDLPNRCPTLASEERFMYRVALSQLCDIDTITVLQDMGFGFIPGPTCMLGRFQPIDEGEADELVSAAGNAE